MLHKDIKEAMKKALLAKEALKLSVLRGLLSAFTNELVSQKRKPDEVLSDEDILSVIKKQAKQRQDSIEQFKKGGRNDLADDEGKELIILSEYLPEQLSEAEISKVAESKKIELGVTDKSKMGILMGAVMKELSGKADGNAVKKIVESLF